MKSDIEIAQEAVLRPITEIAAGLGLDDDHVIPYGRYKAKIDHRLAEAGGRQGRLILVTAISPTPAGEGKTTTSVGLADALCALGKKTMLCLREPSLGPVFGIKGGAAGGGCPQPCPARSSARPAPAAARTRSAAAAAAPASWRARRPRGGPRGDRRLRGPR